MKIMDTKIGGKSYHRLNSMFSKKLDGSLLEYTDNNFTMKDVRRAIQTFTDKVRLLCFMKKDKITSFIIYSTVLDFSVYEDIPRDVYTYAKNGLWVIAIGTRSEYRRKGYASNLFKELKKRCDKKFIFLEDSGNNKIFYEKVGGCYMGGNYWVIKI